MRAAILVLGVLTAACGPSPQSAENLPPAPGTASPDRPNDPPPADTAQVPPANPT